MAPHTASAPATSLAVSSAEPADIFTRLAPDDLHPARLAGPHAWHPWGLTASPPTDRHLRIVLPAGTRPDTRDRLLDRVESRLSKTPWPPAKPLDVRRGATQLDCRDHDTARSLIDVTIGPEHPSTAPAAVVTRDGWPILDELAALTDRINHIDVERPARSDLVDLARWVDHKMATPTGRNPIETPLPHLLADQTRHEPHAADRFAAVLSRARPPTEHHRALDYLHEQMTVARSPARAATLPARH